MTAPGRSLASVARGGVLGLAGAGAGAAAQVALVLVVTRSFPPATAGALFTAMALCLMTAGVVRLDASNGLVHALAHHSSGAERAPMSAYVRAAGYPVIALSTVTGVAVYLLAPTVADVTGVPGEWVRLLALALPFIACADVLVAATRGLGAMGPTTYLLGVVQPLTQLTLICLATIAGSASALPLAWALPYVPVLALAALWLYRHTPPAVVARTEARYMLGAEHRQTGPGTPPEAVGGPGPGADERARHTRHAAAELWRHTGPRAAAGGIQAVFQRLDIVIVAVLAGPVEAACYTAATRFKLIGQLTAQGLAHAVQPRLVRALTGHDLHTARRLYQVTTLWLVALTWPVWIAYAALAPWLPALLGAAYERGAQVAVVLAVTMMIASACGMADLALIAAGHTTTSLANTTIAITVTVAADIALVPAHGALGAALGWSAGVLVKNLLPLFHLHRKYRLRPFGRHTPAALRPRTWHEGAA
ncbi:lipopolysaccharide biosynthesis protein [Spongiactinospora rosea]|uniref:lipopolysaccharide biosynthesis protein n=1 Tax=Spongiactinospora rosea TaxID=2248750 RepID=UPI001CEC6E8B|nr:polysaccharide biosynthesis C-terminal domain-containing protein [Spongiactinospora rosea]